MVLLQDNIIWLEKQLKGVAFDLNMAKGMKMVLWLFTITAVIVICLLVGLVVANIQTLTLADVIVSIIIFGVCVWWMWLMYPVIANCYNEEIAELEVKKEEYERSIEKYKNDMIDLREMEKKVMKSKLTEKQTEILNKYTEKAKQVFKWIIVTKDGEVVASDLKPDYDEEFDVWFFNCEANTIQIGSNKKLAKHSKYTLTKIK